MSCLAAPRPKEKNNGTTMPGCRRSDRHERSVDCTRGRNLGHEPGDRVRAAIKSPAFDRLRSTYFSAIFVLPRILRLDNDARLISNCGVAPDGIIAGLVPFPSHGVRRPHAWIRGCSSVCFG